MTVLVAVASRYEATREIAEAIGRRLGERGVRREVLSVGDVVGLEDYDAVVLGSAVYAGHWLTEARNFVDRHSQELRARPTWLFSSGPIGTPPRPSDDEAVRIDEILAATSPREHRVFAGRLDKTNLTFAERALVFAFRAAEGDFRDWKAVAEWADTIADALSPRDSAHDRDDPVTARSAPQGRSWR
jgi:menaquinone-dependent protoporphyrinogen oxidase